MSVAGISSRLVSYRRLQSDLNGPSIMTSVEGSAPQPECTFKIFCSAARAAIATDSESGTTGTPILTGAMSIGAEVRICEPVHDSNSSGEIAERMHLPAPRPNETEDSARPHSCRFVQRP